MHHEDYRSELPYKENEYKPFGGPPVVSRDENGNPVTHFCARCKLYYKNLHSDGITKREFPKGLACTFDRRLKRRYLSREMYASDEDYEFAWATLDPVTFAETMLDWNPRWYQEEVLSCSSRFRAVRAGRRCGKSALLSVYILWSAFTNIGGRVQGRGARILIICPYQPQVTKIFDNIKELIGKSAVVSDAVKRMVANPQLIQFVNDAQILGFSAGPKSGARADKIRGQDADCIVLDEVDFINDKDFEIIEAILQTNDETELIMSSTPTGARSRLYNSCYDKDGEYKEFWYISAESPKWSIDVETMFRKTYSEGGFNREFNAEFGDEAQGVFNQNHIRACLYDYDLSKQKYDPGWTYVMGVDWNKTTGTHIVVVGRPKDRPIYRLVEKRIIRKSEYTQLRGVAAVQEVDRKWNCSFVYVDAGFGSTQVEMLLNQQASHWEDGAPIRPFKGRLEAVDMGGNWEIIDPETKQWVKKPTKGLMVNLATLQVEEHRCELPMSEDTESPIIPEELAYATIGIVQQMREFKETKISSSGKRIYSQDYEHTLTAWMLSIFGHLMEYADYKKQALTRFGIAAGPLGAAGGGPKVPTHDQFGIPMSPNQISSLQKIANQHYKEKELERQEARREQSDPEPLSDAPVVNNKGEYKISPNGMSRFKISQRRFRERPGGLRKRFR